MTHPTKSRLHLAIAAALGSAALLAVPVSVQAQPPVGSSATNTGDIATAFYMAQPEGGWQTFFNVTNTTDSALAVKVRIKEYKNSREALDFWILMSPYDVWTGWMSQEADGVFVRTVDNTCTSPEFVDAGDGKKKALETQAFYGPAPDNADDGGSETDEEAFERLKMGHVEFIVAGECTSDDSRCFQGGFDPGFEFDDGIGYLTKHVDGVPRDCATANEYFLPRNADGSTPRAPWNKAVVPGNGNPQAAVYDDGGYDSGASPAPLKVNVAYLQVGDGTGAATQAMHLDNAVAPANLVTAQRYPYDLEPTIATAPAGLWDMSGLLDLEQRFTWTNTFNEWSVNPVAGVQTSLMLNFPTKGYHVDQNCNEAFASNNRWRWDGVGVLACANAADAANFNNITPNTDYKPNVTGDLAGVRLVDFPATLQPFPKRWTGKSEVEIGVITFDREEFFLDETYWSPNRELSFLPWEVALVSFDPNGGAFGVTDGEIIIPAPLALGAPNGWINLGFINATDTNDYPEPGADPHGNSFAGLPMHGIMVKSRDLGQPGTAYGQGTENGYDWEYNSAP